MAAAMARRLDLPVIAIDTLLHDHEGRLRDAAAIDADARAAASGERWIIEGGNSRTYAERLARADCLIRLKPPRKVRLLRVMRRGGASVSLLRWTWKYDRVFGLRDDALIASAGHIPVHDLRSATAVDAFLAALPC